MSDWSELFQQHLDHIVGAVVARLRQEVPVYGAMPEGEVRRRAEAGLVPYARDLGEPEPHYFAEYWGATAYDRSSQGIPLDVFLQVLLVATDETLLRFGALLAADHQQQLAALHKGYAITATGIAAVYEGYSRHKDEIIEAQSTTLGEVSSPIVPIYEEILVLPLIGSINSSRASQIMEALLEAISSYSADVVIIDITGVPVIDTAVANYLLQTARAARLLGSTIVLVGTSGEIAQTMVQLGIDLAGITSKANLQAGIEYALATKGLAISATPRALGAARATSTSPDNARRGAEAPGSTAQGC